MAPRPWSAREAPIQRKFISALDAAYPGIERQASAAGARLAGGARSWQQLLASGVAVGDLDVHVREWGRQGEPGL